MSDIIISDTLYTIKNKEAAEKLKMPKGTDPKGGASPHDVMLLCFYLLVQAAGISAEGALVQAKRTKANADAQQQLNKELDQLHFHDLPKEGTVKKREKHTRWSAGGAGPGWGDHKVITYTTRIVHTHSKQQAVQSQNQQIAAERQEMMQKAGVLQQLETVTSSKINTISDESVQSMEEGSQMLSIVKSLTFKALMRNEPR
ncbi:MAG: DUF720 domain-containing protein [Chlamydiales bacterium]|nr:DUF720 domain-containing protein [Chlamydiales bacterium]